jgi:hypothetical protein
MDALKSMASANHPVLAVRADEQENKSGHSANDPFADIRTGRTKCLLWAQKRTLEKFET